MPLMKSIILAASSLSLAFAINMQEAVDLALNNHQQIKEYTLMVERQKHNTDSAESSYFPSLDAAYNYTSSNQKDTRGIKESSYASLGLSYTVFNGFADKYSYRSAEATYFAQKHQLEAIKADLVLQTKTAYINILNAREALNVAKEAKELLARQELDTQRFFNQGMVAKNDLLEVQVNLAKREQELLKAQSDLNIAMHTLGRYIGKPLGKDEAFSNPATDIMVATRDTLEAKMLETRSELLYLQQLEKSAFYSKKALQGNYYPALSISGTAYAYGDDAYPDERKDTYDDETQLSATLSWNLFNGFKDKNDIQAKAVYVKEIQSQLLDLEANLRLQLFTALEEYELAKVQRSVAQKAVEQAEENYRIVENRFKEQMDTTTDLLDAQLLLTQSRSDYNNAYYAIEKAIATLQRITQSSLN